MHITQQCQHTFNHIIVIPELITNHKIEVTQVSLVNLLAQSVSALIQASSWLHSFKDMVILSFNLISSFNPPLTQIRLRMYVKLRFELRKLPGNSTGLSISQSLHQSISQTINRLLNK